MRKMIGSVFFAVFLFPSLLAVAPVAAMPTSGGGGDKHEHALPLQDAVIDDLLVTLEIPKDSPFIVGQTLPEEIVNKETVKKGATKKGAAKKKAGAKNTVSMQVQVIDEKFAFLPMAVIDTYPLTVGEFRKALAVELNEQGEISATVAKQDPAVLLERQVNSLVIIREAREIGLDQVPEVVKVVNVFRRQKLREYLARQQLATVKVDPLEVERLYDEMARESRIKAMLFKEETEAQDFSSQLSQAGSFDELAARFVEAGKGEKKGGVEGEFVRHREMQPELVKAIIGLAPGQATSVLPQNKQFTVIQLLESRLPENPQLRQTAEKRAKNFAGNTALAEMTQRLFNKYVTLDKELFESLDFTVDFEALLQDKRVLAEIKGEEPFTVGDMAEILKGKYYHGVQRAIDQGKVKEDRAKAFNEEMLKRSWLLEAKELGIDQREDFKWEVADHEDSIIFGAFVQQVVVPTIQIGMDDLHKYYEKNIKDYVSPEMIGLRGMVFRDQAKAQEVLASLKRGTEFNWLQSTSEGLVPKDTANRLDVEDQLFVASTMSKDIAAALVGAALGDFRLYADGKEFFYVLLVDKLVPPSVQPFESVKSTILRTVFNQKLEKEMLDWGKKLRKLYKVEVYVKGFNKKQL